MELIKITNELTSEQFLEKLDYTFSAFHTWKKKKYIPLDVILKAKEVYGLDVVWCICGLTSESYSEVEKKELEKLKLKRLQVLEILK